MRFAHEKRRILGWLALLAPLPLPLNEPRPTGVVGWPFLFLWIAVVAFFLRRVKHREERWLGVRSLNLLGLAYLPILAVDLAINGGNILIRPMMHLAMFALAAKLFSMERERDKWHALLGIFFIFVTAVATSTSLGIVVYLVVFLGMAAWVLDKFSSLHMESFVESEGRTEAPPRGPITRRLLFTALVLAVPIFLFLPRFGDPFLFGQGGGLSIVGTGFSDEVRLDGIGRIRTSSEVALRLIYGSRVPPRIARENIRLRGATYDRYQGDGWERTGGESRVIFHEDGTQDVGSLEQAGGNIVSSAEVWLEPLDARAVIVPNHTLRIKTASRVPLLSNQGGALSFLFAPHRAVRYRVDLGDEPRQWAAIPNEETDLTLDQAGVSPRIRALADQVAGSGSPLQVASRIEQHLQTEYDYQLELLGAGDGGAIERFLFERGSGHCEYFASAMVLMLRSQGIPSRFVTGFLGAEVSPTGYSIVRQSNAHAWVEAYLPERGWMEFDPTPAAGRPTAASESMLAFLRQSYDWMLFSWDRYVVGFGSGQQRRFFTRVVDWIKDLWRGKEIGEVSIPFGATPESVEEAPMTESLGTRDRVLGFFGLGGLLVATVVGAIWWRRRRFDALAGYLAVRKAAEAAGLEGDPGPLAFAEEVARRFPSAREPVNNAVVLYLQDSFSPGPLDRQQLSELRLEAKKARRSIREEARKVG